MCVRPNSLPQFAPPRRIGLDEDTPDHSTISRTRRLIDIETHRKVFGWVLGVLADRGLLKGKMVGVDATTLDANAATRSIVRRDNGQRYEAFLTELTIKAGSRHHAGRTWRRCGGGVAGRCRRDD